MEYGRARSREEEEELARSSYQTQNAFAGQWPGLMDIMQPSTAQAWDYFAPGSWWPYHSGTQDPFIPEASFQPQTGSDWLADQIMQTGFDYQGAHFAADQGVPVAGFQALDGAGPPHSDPVLEHFLALNPPYPPTEIEQSRPEGEAKQRVRQRIPCSAKVILQQWFDDHLEDPYLEKEEVSRLAAATGLTSRQVRTFFANARARKLPLSPGTGSDRQLTQTASYTDRSKDRRRNRKHGIRKQERQSSAPLSVQADPATPGGTTSPEQHGPMERYLSSSPEEEGFSEEVLQQHASALFGQHPSATRLRREHQGCSYHDRPTSNADACSEAPPSSNSGSNSSHASVDSAANRIPRRGRKRHRGPTRRSTTVTRERADQSKIYQCTFCTKDFAHKYDWRRHEESVHMPQKEWICMPDGPVRAASGVHFCVFCDLPNPSVGHLQAHNYLPCLGAPRSSRTFTQKDKLLQHLSQVHKQGQMSSSMLTWCRHVERSIVIACGICGVRIPSWNDRVEHIAIHFADGHDMSLWLGAPGGIALANNPDTGQPSAVAAVDPLFPAQPFPVSSSEEEEPSTDAANHHPCQICPVRFPRYVDTVFHERQAHRFFQVRPHASEEGHFVRPPTQLKGGPFRSGLLGHELSRLSEDTIGYWPGAAEPGDASTSPSAPTAVGVGRMRSETGGRAGFVPQGSRLVQQESETVGDPWQVPGPR